MSHRRAVSIVGMGDDGCKGLTARAMDAIARADVLVGGERQLAFVPQFRGERIVLADGIGSALDRVAELAAEHQVCVLASGDPLFFGIGSLVIRKVGVEHVEVVPQPSSIQWAFARAGLKWDDATILSVHGRSVVGIVSRLKACRKAAILTDPECSPRAIADRLAEYGDTGWRSWVCENLAGPDERIRALSLEELRRVDDIGPLNVLLLERTDAAWRPPPRIPFLHEDEFAKRTPKKGLITKREVRLLSLAALGLRADSVVWDVGAGSGSVSIEAALLCPLGRVFAVEVDPEGVDLCRENARAHGVDNVEVVHGRAPEALAGLEAPDAVFVGGSKGSMEEIVSVSLDRLRPGGRLVVNAITLENTSQVYDCLRARGLVPEVTLVQISRTAPLAQYLRFEALNPIQVFAVEKPVSGGAA